MKTKWIGYIAAAAFIATVWAANYAVKHWGIVNVGFGLQAPAGVYFVGLAFTLRDVVHRLLGRLAVVVCILAGATLAYFIEANVQLGGHVSLAVASAIAFLASEFADLTVYERIRKDGWMPAVVASNAFGIVIDSALFLWLAFGSLAFFWGQVVGKAWMTVLAIIVLLVLNRTALKKLQVV